MTDQYVHGIHAVQALLANPHRKIKKLFINSDRTDQKLQTLVARALEMHVPLEKLSQKLMNQRFEGSVHQGIVAMVPALPEFSESDLPQLLQASKKPALILVLDGVTDPHNLGACLRTADATGVDFLIIPKDKSASVNSVVTKVACGAAEFIPVVKVTNLVRAMEMIKQEGIWIYGATDEASHNLYELDCQSSIALVMGAEGEGMRRLTREHCDGLFSIPMLGSVSSLNVSVATGVSLYEVVRQRQKI